MPTRKRASAVLYTMLYQYTFQVSSAPRYSYSTRKSQTVHFWPNERTPGSTFCADSYFGIRSTRVTAVARKRPRSSCQKCRWQVTAKHAYIKYAALHEVTWSVHGCMWHTENLRRLRRAAVSCGTSHASAVSTPLRWTIKNVP